MYTIGQAADITGISRDRLRYYEEKRILKPSINKDNQYRQYSEENIVEILSIELFRSMDLGMKDIKAIRDHSDADSIGIIISRKRDEVLTEIAKQQQNLNNINVVYEVCTKLKDYRNTVSIHSLPAFEVIGEITDTKAFSEYRNIHNKKAANFPIMKSLLRQVTFSETGIDTNRMLIVRELETGEGKGQGKILQYEHCLYTIAEESLGEADIMPSTFKKCMQWIRENHYKSLGIAFIRVLFMTYPDGELTSYLEIFCPVEKK